MHDPLNPDETRASGGLWAGSVVMTGFVAGHALQLQQAVLWPAARYGVVLAIAVGLGLLARWLRGGWVVLPAAAAAARAPRATARCCRVRCQAP